jgi:NTE family protein
MSVQTGALWRFSRPYMGDYRVGLFSNPEVDIATAVAASSAFPPFLSPVTLDLSGATPQPGTAGDLHVSPYTETAVLTDGGVYDNLGLEPVWKRFDTIIASDGGRRMMAEPSPATDWARHSRRLIDLLQSQTRSLRRRQLIGSLDRGKNSQNDREEMIRNQGRLGAYWGIQTNIDDYQLPDALPAPARFTSEIAAIETRLAALENQQQEHLINWGYAVCDAVVRSANVGLPLPPRPPRFPYQRGVM